MKIFKWVCFTTIMLLSLTVIAADKKGSSGTPRVIYPKESKLDFEGLALQGEVRNPGEFYFQHKPEEKFDSLVRRRAHFHREMLRDVILSR